VIAAAIDTSALLRLVLFSALAGVSVAVVFSLGVFGVVRGGEMRREGRRGRAVAYAALTGGAATLVLAIIVLGLVFVTRK
jgi:hypothetical protein